MITLYSEYSLLNVKLIDKTLKLLYFKSREKIFPGQFYMIYVKGIGEIPIFPFVSEENILCFLISGDSNIINQKLFLLKPKESIFIRGPYGHGFPMNNFLSKEINLICNENMISQTNAVLNYIHKNENDYKKSRLIQITSKKLNSLINHLDLSKELEIYNIDSIEQLNVNILTDMPKKDKIYLVLVDFKDVKLSITSLIKLGINEKNIYFFINRKITCGTGICGSCATKSVHNCTDGPVFKADMMDKVL